jgi:hypothetical protein
MDESLTLIRMVSFIFPHKSVSCSAICLTFFLIAFALWMVKLNNRNRLNELQTNTNYVFDNEEYLRASKQVILNETTRLKRIKYQEFTEAENRSSDKNKISSNHNYESKTNVENCPLFSPKLSK